MAGRSFFAPRGPGQSVALRKRMAIQMNVAPGWEKPDRPCAPYACYKRPQISKPGSLRRHFPYRPPAARADANTNCVMSQRVGPLGPTGRRSFPF